jgi:uncharacterized membrane protein YfcA
VLSTAYSLFVVGLTSLVGSYSHFKTGHVHVKTALVFGVPSIISVYATRKFIMPVIPDPVFSVASIHVYQTSFCNGAVCRTDVTGSSVDDS